MPYIQVFVEHEARECPMCGKRFIPKHGKRRFCEPKCQNRYGVRQYRQRKREERMMQPQHLLVEAYEQDKWVTVP